MVRKTEMDTGRAITEILLVLKGCLFLVLVSAVLGVSNSEHVAAGNNISHGGRKLAEIPALELRHLDPSIYQIQNRALLRLLDRRDVGRTDGTDSIRYPGDAYDRFWSPMPSDLEDDWIQISTNSIISASSRESSDEAYRLPDEVMKTAAKTQNASMPLEIYYDVTGQTGPLPKYYGYFHFAEVEKLLPDQQRKLTISLNGELDRTETAKLGYLISQTIIQDNLPIRGAWLNFSIKALQGTLPPPILNAYEIFELIELPIEPTATDDVKAIMEIKTWYKVTRNWQGDPCVPSEYSWDGLNCTNDNPPRIISLNLSSSNLTGDIATSFSKLELLQSLDLRGNKLTGSIPEALLEQFRNGKLDLRVDANPDFCGLYTPCKRDKKKNFVTPVVASSIVAVLFLLFIFSALAIYRRKRGDMVPKSNIGSKKRQYSYSEVVNITNNFKTIVGGGEFGKVYLGTMKDKIQVAVKSLSPSSKQGYKEFRAEAELLTVVHHRNLVTLVGYCDEDENKALIYEYMANGNLQQHLSVTKPNVLTWNERLGIAVDVAHGLEYLHNGCKPPIIHRDLKPSNILLDERMQAKIADFGLSRAFATESDSHSSTCPAGTLGYLDPEFLSSRNLSTKSDVYSFGIILFELITGRPAIITGPMRNTHILEWVYPLIERADIQNIVDPRLEGEFNTTSAWKVVEIAMSCALPIVIQRPDMSQVLTELKESLALVMTGEKIQRMATECSTSSMPYNTFHVELESEIGPTAR